ncbi:uncharacterized protein METZ01_LOCUS197695 [marine metagenome]|uniref:Uncharacterized protein n=1 Tax=marine metagenome TaxID=408172 RepID=A0A382E4B9_9ZZZZ
MLTHVFRRTAKGFKHQAAPDHALGMAHTGYTADFYLRLMHAQREKAPDCSVNFATLHLNNRWAQQAGEIPSGEKRAKWARDHG